MLVSVCLFTAGCQNEHQSDGSTTNAQTDETTTKNGGQKETTEIPDKETTNLTSSTAEKETTATTKEEETSSTTVNIEELTGKEKHPDYLDIDFGGKEFLIASRLDTDDGWNNGREIWSESLNNTTMNDAVFERNQIMHELYNCTVKLDDKGWANGYNADVSAGGGKYISGCQAYSGGFTNANNYNVLNFDIDYTNSWWDQAWFRDLSCNGKLAGLSGDMAYHMMRATWIMFYNKDVYEQNLINTYDVYDLVRKGKWTFDVLYEMCQKVTDDRSGDGKITFSEGADADIVGLITHQHNDRAIYFACGERYVTKDASGKFVMALTLGKGSDVIDKLLPFYTSDSYLNVGYTSIPVAIQNNTALFACEVLGKLEELDSETLRVGILPFPKFDENQENYFNYVNNQGTYYTVPVSYSDIDTISAFFDLFAYHSQKIVRSAFIDLYKHSYASDEDSGEMLDLILDSRIYDPGYFLNFGTGFDGSLSSMFQSGKNQFSNAATRQTNTINTNIANFEKSLNNIKG